MQLDEKTYHEYAGWQLEYSDLLVKFKTDAPDLYYRIKHVFDVIDYLYGQITEDDNYSNEEDEIFKTGFYYVANQVAEIKEIVDKYYNGDFKLANDHAIEINFLFNTLDFQSEIYIQKLEESVDVKRLLELDEDILKHLENKESLPPALFEELDQLLFRIFDESDINYLTVNNIFLEIADHLNIL